MTKSEIATVLEEVAALLELKGENPFKIRAYTNAARSIETFGGNVSDLQDEEALSKIPGIGKSIAEKIKELAATGSLKYLEELRTEFPAAILELFSISGLGAKKIKALYEQLQVSSIAAIAPGMRNRPRRETARLRQNNTGTRICKAIEERAKHSGIFQLGQIAAEAETMRSDLARASRGAPGHACRAVIGGEKKLCAISISSWRQKSRQRSRTFFVAHPLVESVIAQGPTKSSVRLRSGIQCDLRVVSAAEYPFALNYFTGSKEHNIVVRNRALQRGWTLNEYRLARASGDRRQKKKRPRSQNPGGARRGGFVSSARSRLHPAGTTRELRRIRSRCRENTCSRD